MPSCPEVLEAMVRCHFDAIFCEEYRRYNVAWLADLYGYDAPTRSEDDGFSAPAMQRDIDERAVYVYESIRTTLRSVVVPAVRHLLSAHSSYPTLLLRLAISAHTVHGVISEHRAKAVTASILRQVRALFDVQWDEVLFDTSGADHETTARRFTALRSFWAREVLLWLLVLRKNGLDVQQLDACLKAMQWKHGRPLTPGCDMDTEWGRFVFLASRAMLVKVHLDQKHISDRQRQGAVANVDDVDFRPEADSTSSPDKYGAPSRLPVWRRFADEDLVDDLKQFLDLLFREDCANGRPPPDALSWKLLLCFGFTLLTHFTQQKLVAPTAQRDHPRYKTRYVEKREETVRLLDGAGVVMRGDPDTQGALNWLSGVSCTNGVFGAAFKTACERAIERLVKQQYAEDLLQLDDDLRRLVAKTETLLGRVGEKYFEAHHRVRARDEDAMYRYFVTRFKQEAEKVCNRLHDQMIKEQGGEQHDHREGLDVVLDGPSVVLDLCNEVRDLVELADELENKSELLYKFFTAPWSHHKGSKGDVVIPAASWLDLADRLCREGASDPVGVLVHYESIWQRLRPRGPGPASAAVEQQIVIDGDVLDVLLGRFAEAHGSSEPGVMPDDVRRLMLDLQATSWERSR